MLIEDIKIRLTKNVSGMLDQKGNLNVKQSTCICAIKKLKFCDFIILFTNMAAFFCWLFLDI